ncbi:MAG: DUF2298 domain-containing protein, partial [Thermomicrobiales bacterium]
MERRPALFHIRQPAVPTLVCAVVVLAALMLRLYGLNWDDGYYLHPDELHVVNTITTKISLPFPIDFGNLIDPEQSTLNPRSLDPASGRHTNFAYGVLPLYATDATATALGWLTDRSWNAADRIYLVGRVLGAVLDSATVGIVYLLGRRVASPPAAVLAAMLYAAAPIQIQLSHFFTTDVWMTFFVAATLLWAIKSAESGSLRSFSGSGFAFGLAMACKGSAATLTVVLMAALFLDVRRRRSEGEATRHAIAALPERLAVAGVAALAGFALFEPYAVARPIIYLRQLSEQSEIVRGTFDVPFTRQYVGTTPFLYQIGQLLHWGLGPMTGVLCLLGVAMMLLRVRFDLEPGPVILLTWLAAEGLAVGLPETKFLRYASPLIPALAVAGGVAFERIIVRLGRVRWRAVRPVATTAMFIAVGVWTASFTSIYAAPNPRVSASQWMFTNIPTGSSLTAETWDLALPVDLAPGLSGADFQYRRIPMDIYGDRDPAVVADDIYRTLSQADYVVLASNRLSGAVTHSPWRYPVQIRYYQLLRSGALGFTLAADFHRFPGIAGFRVDDRSADESFINYDHPQVLLYKKSTLVARGVYDQLMAGAESRPTSPTRHADAKSLMLDKPVGDQPAVNDGRWSERLTGHSWAALLIWILLLVALQAIGAPFAAALFGRFADLGWGLARLLALLLTGYLVWIGASLNLFAFRAIWSFAALAVVAALAVLLWRGQAGGRHRRRRREIAGAEIVFWAVFALFLIFRWVNPDSWHPIWGGEKPMEFAHLNATLRSAHFPPYDPWFSGGYINYYYYGLYLVALCIKLTGIPSEIAFNLAQPTVIALLAGAGYSVAATVGRDASSRTRRPLAGWIGALLLVGIGNLSAFLKVVRTFPDPVHPDFYDWTWAGSRAITGAITEFPYFTGLYADLHAHVIAWPITVLAIALCYALAGDTRSVLLALTESPQRGHARAITAARLIALALVFGTLAATNAWDVAVYAALFVVSAFMATRLLHSLALRLSVTGIAAAATAGAAYLLFRPFFQHYVALFGSLQRTRSQTALGEFLTHLGALLLFVGVGTVVALARGRGDALPRAVRDPLVVLAAATAVILAALILRGTTGTTPRMTGVLIVGGAAFLFGSIAAGRLRRSAGSVERAANLTVLAAGAAGLAAAAVGRPVFGLALLFAGAGAALWLGGANIGVRFTGAMLAAASLILAGMELVFLVDDLAPDPVYYRMNTVFKFDNQVWTLLAIVAAVLVAVMASSAFPGESALVAPRPDDRIPPERGESADVPVWLDGAVEEVRIDGAWHERAWARAGLGVSLLAVAASLFYPFLATLPRLDQRFPGHPARGTLNALSGMDFCTVANAQGQEITFADDRRSIDWFNHEFDG